MSVRRADTRVKTIHGHVREEGGVVVFHQASTPRVEGVPFGDPSQELFSGTGSLSHEDTTRRGTIDGAYAAEAVMRRAS